MEKIFKQILSEICKKNDFSFVIAPVYKATVKPAGKVISKYSRLGYEVVNFIKGKKSLDLSSLEFQVRQVKKDLTEDLLFTLVLTYNNGAGTGKMLLDKSFEGLHGFVTALIEHPNKTAAVIAPEFYAQIKPVEVAAPVYVKSKTPVYFNRENFMVIDENTKVVNSETKVKGTAFTSDRLPGLTFVKHPKIGGEISVLISGQLLSIGGFDTYESKDRLANAIEKIASLVYAEEFKEMAQRAIDSKTIALLQDLEHKQALAKFAAENSTDFAPAIPTAAPVEDAPAMAPAASLAVNNAGALVPVNGTAYTLTGEVVYFDAEVFEIQKKFKGCMSGEILVMHRYPQFKIVQHAPIAGSCLSFIYDGFLYEFASLGTDGEIIPALCNTPAEAIAHIEKMGLENVLKLAEQYAAEIRKELAEIEAELN